MQGKKRVLFIVVLFMLLMGCGSINDHQSLDSHPYEGQMQYQSGQKKLGGASQDPVLIYTSIYPLYDFAVKIGGEQVEVKTIVPPGADAHDFEPTPNDIMALHQADLFIYNGLGMEPWLESLLSAIDNPSLITVNSTAHLMDHPDGSLAGSGDHQEAEHADHHDHRDHTHPHGLDPHVWLDPLLAKEQAKSIYEALVEVDPDHADDYKSNFKALEQSFDTLHNRFDTMTRQAERRHFVVSHQAYGYLAERYGLKQVAIAGLSPTQEPGPKRMEEIIRFVRENDVKYILFEYNVAHNVAQVIQTETGTEVLRLSNLETLSKEEMDQGQDYFSVMERNLDVLAKALGQKENE